MVEILIKIYDDDILFIKTKVRVFEEINLTADDKGKHQQHK